MYVYACMYMNHVCAWCIHMHEGKFRRQSRFPWNFSSTWLWAIWALGTQFTSSARATSTHNSWVISRPNFKFRKDPIGETKGYANLTYQFYLDLGHKTWNWREMLVTGMTYTGQLNTDKGSNRIQANNGCIWAWKWILTFLFPHLDSIIFYNKFVTFWDKKEK